MAAKVTIEIGVIGFNKLADYLASHEDDIALEMNDFGDLCDIYVAVFDEDPEKD